MIRAFLSGLPVIAAVSAAALGGVILLKNAEERELRDVIGGWEACALEVQTGERRAEASACPSPIAAADRAARRAARCDAALAAADAFAAEAACSAAVKRLSAERAAAAGERDDLKTLLARVRSDQAAAIARAEARGRSQTQRTERVQADLDAQPRTDGGLGRCDADCLRDLGADR